MAEIPVDGKLLPMSRRTEWIIAFQRESDSMKNSGTPNYSILGNTVILHALLEAAVSRCSQLPALWFFGLHHFRKCVSRVLPSEVVYGYEHRAGERRESHHPVRPLSLRGSRYQASRPCAPISYERVFHFAERVASFSLAVVPDLGTCFAAVRGGGADSALIESPIRFAFTSTLSTLTFTI